MAPTEILLAALPLAVGAIAPDPQLQIFCITAFGGLMGGFVATVLRDKLTAKRKAQEPPPEPAKAFLMRWLTHISASVFIAPGLTFHYHHNFPEIPVETFALAVGGLTGVAAQAVLLIAIPTIILWALRKFLPNANDLLPPKDS